MLKGAVEGVDKKLFDDSGLVQETDSVSQR